MARRSRNASASIREIGEPPPVPYPWRRACAEKSLRYFCRRVMPGVFTAPFSQHHLRLIERLEQIVRRGGLFAMAMPRGGGKSMLCDAAVLWAVLCGHHRYVALIAATQKKAQARVEKLRRVLRTSPELLELWPEVAYPIRRMEGTSNRVLLYRGEPIEMTLAASEVQLPTLPPSAAAGAYIEAAGITGDIRGMNRQGPNGEAMRPTLALVDDPSTEESALSPSQNAFRERVIRSAVLGLAGPGRRMAAVMPCTTVAENDLACRMLDRSRNPQWYGERIAGVEQFPERMDLWDDWRRVAVAEMQQGGDGRLAQDFIRERYDDMHAGASVWWPDYYDREEYQSALHQYLTRFYEDPDAFHSEIQQQPQPEDLGQSEQLHDRDLADRINGYKRREIPAECQHLTAFVDVQKACLYWLVAAWEADFTGYVIDYGTWPDQRRSYFTLRDARRTLTTHYKGRGLQFEGLLRQGLADLEEHLAGKPWKRADGGELHLARMLVDANWNESTLQVRQHCRQSKRGGVVFPAHGRYVKPTGKPFIQWPKRKGEQTSQDGTPWRTSMIQKQRHVVFDTNWWKSFLATRLQCLAGERSSVTFWGKGPRNQEMRHQMLAEHLAAWRRKTWEGEGRTVEIWDAVPGRDDHLADCLVGATVAASTLGVTLDAGQSQRKRRKKRKRVTYA